MNLSFEILYPDGEHDLFTALDTAGALELAREHWDMVREASDSQCAETVVFKARPARGDRMRTDATPFSPGVIAFLKTLPTSTATWVIAEASKQLAARFLEETGGCSPAGNKPAPIGLIPSLEDHSKRLARAMLKPTAELRAFDNALRKSRHSRRRWPKFVRSCPIGRQHQRGMRHHHHRAQSTEHMKALSITSSDTEQAPALCEAASAADSGLEQAVLYDVDLNGLTTSKALLEIAGALYRHEHPDHDAMVVTAAFMGGTVEELPE